MEDSTIWKEAKSSGEQEPEQEEIEDADGWDEQEENLSGEEGALSQVSNESGQEEEVGSNDEGENFAQAQVARRFTPNRINLLLKRNITAVSDPKQHKPKHDYFPDSRTVPFDSWLANAIVAISPNADLILFASRVPEKVTFYAKLDPKINQYNIKTLSIPLDRNEQVTSLLCLPILSNQKSFPDPHWMALIVGLSTGYVKFYTEQSICLLNLSFSSEPVVGLKCQTLKQNGNGRSETHFAMLVDELLVTYKSSCIVLDGMTLYDNLRLAQEEMIRNGFNYEPAYTLTNLPSILNCQKLKFETLKGATVCEAELFGTRKTTLFDSFKIDSLNPDLPPTKACSRHIAIIGQDPFVSFCREPKETKTHSYTEMIGSLFSIFNKKPEPSRTQITEISDSSIKSLYDKDRLATSIVPSPDKRLAAITDDFGRVLLLDVTNGIVVRMWKGYRSAQCGWIEVKRNPERRDSPHASFLVIYAPKRGLLEVWSTQRGPRVAAYNVGKHCRLLYSGYKMLNMRADQKGVSAVEQSYSSNCYLLNAQSETVFSIELPYTYSLYKYGDLKSRDHLLINEVINAIQQDAEVSVFSEILNRIALADSLQVSIHKISASLTPDKIAPIMENLINKTMKNYDNQAGEPISDDDKSIIELCKRIIRLCGIFQVLIESPPHELTLPDVNQRLIDQYEEHPQEVDEFSNQLGWSAPEVLRYLSLLTLERSYRAEHLSNPWPSMGEPLAWSEFISCFDLNRVSYARKSRKSSKISQDIQPIRLRKFNSEFLNEDKVMKAAIFMYNRLSETYYKSTLTSSANPMNTKLENTYNHLEPSSRLALLVQFWLSTKLCNHWKMWAYLQNQIGQISDELKVIAMEEGDDRILVETWKQIYQLILESDNIFAAIIATATIKSDTLRMIQDNEKREKLERKKERANDDDDDDADDEEEDRRSSIDWECLCIDAERMALLTQQLEDVFLLNLLLKFSPNDGHLVDKFVYRTTRISVANILRAGPTIVSELVAQWAVQSGVDLKVLIQPYGSQTAQDESEEVVIADNQCAATTAASGKFRLFSSRPTNHDYVEHTKELIHHTKTSYPCSLQPDVLLMNCVWEFCRRWSGDSSAGGGGGQNKLELLRRAYDGLKLLSRAGLRHKLSCLVYQTFFHKPFERLSLLVETNSPLLNGKSGRLRDTFTRKELNMGEECLEEFVQFCCDLSEFMLQTHNEASRAREVGAAAAGNNDKEAAEKDLEAEEEQHELEAKLLAYDGWWSTTTTRPHQAQVAGMMMAPPEQPPEFPVAPEDERQARTRSLVKTTLFMASPLDVDFLVELNSLASLMNLIFRLNIIKAYPMSLMGEEARQTLAFDMQKVAGAADLKLARPTTSSLLELRQRFAQKCIVNLVAKMSEECNEFEQENDDDEDLDGDLDDNDDDDLDDGEVGASLRADEDIDTKAAPQPQSLTLSATKSTATSQRRRRRHNNNGNNMATGSKTSSGDLFSLDASSATAASTTANNVDADFIKDQNNESMLLFGCLLSLANEWELDCDELHLRLVFELYRCNHDKMAAQMSTRVQNRQTLASGLLKIASQRVLCLCGLSPQVSGPEWRRRSDKWSIFQPNVASWLKTIQQEEMKREIGPLKFGDSFRSSDSATGAYGLQHFVLRKLRQRTRLVLENVTNHLDGQAGRLAYDLLQLLKSRQLLFSAAAGGS